MKTKAALLPISKPLLIGCAGIILGFSACNSPEQTVKIIGKKARQKVGRLCTSTKINAQDCLPEMDDVFTVPSLSDQFSDKTEIISTW
ncbi:hypothetical protein [Sediminibacterium sp. TEGAF015]|uniref:hypothetical protein n=1 Tax=Sediminibacterium sp. TEGAF015 TaxID=575378 RepID=UPI00220A494C|nr:hypothetical protein [Sediminibacterium sp. TEGAF015]BDQ11202.1 hypothetical protein TEGAF0_04190 [Sediminibacterium sp. TEGAF015]